MASKRPPDEMATVDELIEALRRLTVDERLRLYRLGDVMALGSEFASGRELFSEAVKRALIGTSGEREDGERGRPWPKTVDLVAFLMECMRSIANGSQNSVKQKVDRRAEALATEDGVDNPHLSERERHYPSVEEELIERQEREARQAAAEADVAAIRGLFAQGDVVHEIMDGEEIGMTPDEIRQATGMTATAYASGRKKLRRTVDKHYPGRSKA